MEEQTTTTPSDRLPAYLRQRGSGLATRDYVAFQLNSNSASLVLYTTAATETTPAPTMRAFIIATTILSLDVQSEPVSLKQSKIQSPFLQQDATK